MRTPYYEITGFDQVNLEDSWVLGILHLKSQKRILFKIQVILHKEHPMYRRPRKGQHHYWILGEIVFPEIKKISWIENNIANIVRLHENLGGAPADLDFGNIDVLFKENETFYLEGYWGAMEIVSAPPILSL